MIANLQILRAVAAWMVVAHHMREPLSQVWSPLGETLIFAAGVDLFFVLSGFVMVASTSGRDVSPSVFLRRRAARIVPLYWLVTLVLVAGLLAGLSPAGVHEWRWSDAIGSLAFLGFERSDGYPGPLLGVGWTLAHEAFFYLIFGLCLAFRGARAAVAVQVLICALVAVGAVWRPEAFGARFYFAPILMEFAFGVGLGLFFGARETNKRGGNAIRPARAIALITFGAFGLFVGGAALVQLAPSGDLITPGGSGAVWRTLFFGVPAALIIAGAVAAERAGVALRWRFASDQGDASYALYLIHLPLLQVLGKALDGPAFLLIAPPVLAFAAHIVHRRLEAPMTGALNDLAFRRYRLSG